MKLIDNWQQAWKLKSVQVGAISAFFYVFMYAAFELLWQLHIFPTSMGCGARRN